MKKISTILNGKIIHKNDIVNVKTKGLLLKKRTVVFITHDGQKLLLDVRNQNIELINYINLYQNVCIEITFEMSFKNNKYYNNIVLQKITVIL